MTTLNPNERQQEINALVSGRIGEWFVRDRSRVEKGEPIGQAISEGPLSPEEVSRSSALTFPAILESKAAEFVLICTGALLLPATMQRR